MSSPFFLSASVSLLLYVYTQVEEVTGLKICSIDHSRIYPFTVAPLIYKQLLAAVWKMHAFPLNATTQILVPSFKQIIPHASLYPSFAGF